MDEQQQETRWRVEQLSRSLLERGQQVATAESCTGGWLAKVLTDLPGSSAWFGYGWVSYSNAAKMQMLGVKRDTLQEFGAVSRQVVEEMAIGARKTSGADWSVSISGVAGPGGGSREKPVGLVWLGCSGIQYTSARSHQFQGDRESIRAQAVACALDLLLEQMTVR